MWYFETFKMAQDSQLQDYEVVAPLGRGAHSFVYQVIHRASGNQYALKVLEKSKLEKKKLL